MKANRPRYPLSALVDATGMTEAALARRVGLSGTTLKLAREVGLQEAPADRYATRCGFHPYQVWPEMLDHHQAQLDAEEAERLERKRRIARESARKRYAESAEVRAKRKANAKVWRDANKRTVKHHASRQPDALREQRRRYYERHAETIKAKKRARYAADAALREAKKAAMREYGQRRRQAA